jgi:acyl-CoA-binding protein
MQYQIKQERTYTTWLTIEADSQAEAEAKYLQMVEEGTSYEQELEQMNVDGEDYTIYPI